MKKKVTINVYGKVQGIMFRQTFIRAAIKRELDAGATNDPNDRNHVTCSMEGDDTAIEELIHDLAQLDKLNSWGAKVDKVERLSDYLNYSSHEVTTENVDEYKWSTGVEFYL